MSGTNSPTDSRRIGLAVDILEFTVAPIPHWYQRAARSVLEAYDREVFATPPIPDDLLLMWFTDAWSIVRNMHTVAQLMRKTKGDINITVTDKQMALLEACTRMRNSMDHVVESIPNHAKKISSPMPPLLGTLTAVVIPRVAERGLIEELDYILVTRSAHHHNLRLDMEQSEDEIFPSKGRLGHLRLDAYDQIVDISDAADLAQTIYDQMRPLLIEMAERRTATVLVRTLNDPRPSI